MASGLEVFPISLPGGINQSAAAPGESDLEELENFAIYRGRMGVRAPLKTIATLQDDQGTPQDVDAVLDIVDHEGKLYALTYSDGQNDVYLHSMQVDGTSVTLEATVYSGVSSKPVLKMTSFEGGTSTSRTSRLYISDYNQNLATVYWDGSAIQNATEDFNNDDTSVNIKFSLMIDYKFHLWGTGYFEEGADLRPEMLRFSQPGLVPGTDSAGGDNPKEWFSADHREVGRRGDKILALSKAGDRLIVFQKRATHAIFGSGGDTWTRQELSGVIGCVGPFAVTSVDERVCYFWASDGPYRTNGSQIQYIGGPIRQLAVDVDAAETDTQVGYSPDDGMVYFIVSDGGQDQYSLALAFHHRSEKWMKAEWLVGSSTPAEFGAVEFLDSAAAPGPEAAPSSLSAAAQNDSQIDLSWTNGDVNVNTVTHIYRDTSSGFTPNDATNQIDTVGSGVESYSDTGLSQDTEYFYKVRHFRNTSHSSESNQDSDTTWLQEPTGMGLAGLTDGLAVNGTNNATGADIEIQRRLSGGSFSTITTLSNPGGSFSYDDTGLTCGTTYFYRARAKKTGSTTSEWSDTVDRQACDAATAPTAPSGASATADSETQITVGWTDNADNEDEYEVYRGTSSGNLSFHASLSPNAEEYVDSGLSSDTEYFYQVRACNNVGCSSFTSEVSATTDPNLDAPSDLAASENGTDQIDLTWTDTADDETSWEIHQSDDGGTTYSQIDTLGANKGEYSATGLSADTTYHFKVRAVTASVDGSFSNEASATTLGNPPTAPSGLTATKDGTSPESQINLSWTDNSTKEDDQEIFRDSGGGFSKIATVATNAVSYEDTGLSAGTTYTYKVRACHDADGCSSFSNTDSATTDGSSSAPADPSGLTATYDRNPDGDADGHTIVLAWTDNSDDEDEFIIERCVGSGCSSFTQLATVGAGVESYRDSTVSADTTYNYRVKASNTTGDSGYSNEDSATTEEDLGPTNAFLQDDPFCDGNIATPRMQVSWTTQETNGLEKRELHRSPGGLLKTETSDPANFISYTDTSVSCGTAYLYTIIDYYGSTGDNQGQHSDSTHQKTATCDIDCSPF